MSNEIPQPGSIISLVSNAQLRYEGTLELIKMGPEESSLSLSNVKSFGTEDRVEPSRHVPPSEDRFEYVVFKGTDIILLDVKEYYRGPPRQGYAPPPAPAYSPQQQRSAVWSPPSHLPQQDGSWGATQPPQPPSQQPTPPQYAQPSAPPAPAAGKPAPAPAPTVLVTPSLQPGRQGETRQPPAPRQSAWSNARPAAAVAAQPAAKSAPAPQPSHTPHPSHAAALQQADSTGPPPGFSGPPPGIKQSVPLPHAAPTSYANAAGADAANGGRGRGRGRERGRGRGPREAHANGPPRAPPVQVPNEDFDFEKGLSRFDKDKIKEEADHEGPQELPGVPSSYNKDDFFDELSNDLNDRLTTGDRPHRRPFSEQRKLDAETFGGSGRARRPMRGRGGGRSDRGRGERPPGIMRGRGGRPSVGGRPSGGRPRERGRGREQTHTVAVS